MKQIKLLRLSIAISLLVNLFGCVSTNTQESTGQYIDSASTTAKVKATLVRNLGVGSVTKIEVTTYKGVVQLSGFVNNQQDIATAVEATKHVPGVVAVENSLLVRTNLQR